MVTSSLPDRMMRARVEESTRATLIMLPEVVRLVFQGQQVGSRQVEPVRSPAPEPKKEWAALLNEVALRLEKLLSEDTPDFEKRVRVTLASDLSALRPTARPRITLWSYLRTMWAVLWTAFRHPLTTSLIDPYTGEVLKR